MPRKMTAAEVKAAQTKLGLTNAAFAAALDVGEKTVEGWRRNGAPAIVRLAIAALKGKTTRTVAKRKGPTR